MPLFERDGYDAKAIANYFLSLAAQEAHPVTNLHLQKILYNAHGYHLAMFEKPLFWQTIQAWKLGPVISDVYYQFRSNGKGPIEGLAVHFDEERGQEIPYHAKLPVETRRFLKRVWNGHKNVSPFILSEISHRPGTPWSLVTAGKDLEVHYSIPIPNAYIQSYFERFLKPKDSVTSE